MQLTAKDKEWKDGAGTEDEDEEGKPEIQTEKMK